jgi:hypothetical protein
VPARALFRALWCTPCSSSSRGHDPFILGLQAQLGSRHQSGAHSLLVARHGSGAATPASHPGRPGARPRTRVGRRAPRRGPTPPGPADAASHSEWHRRHVRRSSSNSPAATPRADRAPACRRDVAARPGRTYARSESSAHRASQPPVSVYAEVRGHRQIILSPHNPRSSSSRRSLFSTPRRKITIYGWGTRRPPHRPREDRRPVARRSGGIRRRARRGRARARSRGRDLDVGNVVAAERGGESGVRQRVTR